MTPLLLLPIFAANNLEAIPATPNGPVRVRFDADWRFRRNPIDTLTNGPGLPWTWRKATGADEPLPVEREAWQTATREDVFGGRPGYAWFKTVLPAQPANPKRVLHFEAVDDNATVWVNGTKLLHHEGWNEPFDVPLKDVWHADSENVVYVLVENQGGGGGIQAPANLRIITAPVTAPEASPSYNDDAWRKVHLPHDYVVEGTFEESSDTGHGSLPTPTAWYRKSFTVPRSYRGKSVSIDFDGVFRKATVYLNGQKLGTHPSGYVGVRYDLTKALNYGGRNVLSVFVDPRQYEGWWYEGGGIYRHVWINATDRVHLVQDGTFIKPKVDGAKGIVTGTAEVVNTTSVPSTVALYRDIIDPSGQSVGSRSQPSLVTLAPGETKAIAFGDVIAKPKLWSPGAPNLYRVQLSLSENGTRSLDNSVQTIGFRTAVFDKDKGFFLNGKRIELKGTCNHIDHAGVGIAVSDNLQIWRLKQLQKIGCNAVRCSHNPPSVEFLDACDRLGILVMDETRHLGDTEMAKTPNTAKADDLGELKAMLRRDRNHPSIIMWSLANEEGIAASKDGARIYAAMKKVTYALDGTRPVTAAMNFGWDSQQGFGPLLDIMGFNYNIGVYDRIRKLYPDKPMLGSETASTVSTRGEYKNDPEKGYVSAYDVNYPGWAATAEAAWKPIAERPWMAGAFVWTGFDYKGEPTPYGWPCINSHFGILDMCGFPKDNAWYYRAWWGNQPVAHILPHWNHPGQEGKPINVWVHSNAETIELLLNGQSLGTKTMPRYGHLQWDVPYEPGKLEAVGRTDGKIVARDLVETTGAPAALRLKADSTLFSPNGEDTLPVAVEVVDAEGRVVPEADDLVSFSTVGVGMVEGVGNGDPSSHEPDQASQRKAFHGLAQVLVRAGYVEGKVTLTAKAPGLKPATLVLTAKR